MDLWPVLLLRIIYTDLVLPKNSLKRGLFFILYLSREMVRDRHLYQVAWKEDIHNIQTGSVPVVGVSEPASLLSLK